MNTTQMSRGRRTLARGLRAAGVCAAVATLASSAIPQSTLVGTITTQGAPVRCKVQSRWAYVLTGLGLEIFRASAFSTPGTLGVLPLPQGDKYDLAISDAYYVYVPSAAFGVYIIDVVNPSSPWIAGQIPLTVLNNDADFVEIADGRLYVFSADDGFRVFDIGANPTAPPHIGTYDPPTTSHYFQDGQVSGTTLFACDSFNGLTALDVSNPAAITKLADSGLANTQSWDVAVLGELAVDLPFTGSLLRFYDVTPPIMDPLPLVDSEPVTGSGWAFEVDAAKESNGNKYAYSVHDNAGCKIWLINDPTNVQLVETLPGTTGARGVTFHRGLLFLSVDTPSVNQLQIWQR